MALTVLVCTYAGEKLSESMAPAVDSLCRLASERGFPFLGSVDVYVDTTFNRMQVSRVLSELESLREICGPDESSAIEEILAMIGLVQRKPHRYLVFNGD